MEYECLEVDMLACCRECSLCSILTLFYLICFQHFRGLSFPTISAVGPNAAICHYKPEAETCTELDPDKIYLFDSGAQVCLACVIESC